MMTAKYNQPCSVGIEVMSLSRDLIASGGLRQLGQAIRRNRFGMMAVGGAWPVTPLLAAAESQFAPDAIDSLAAVAVSPLAKLGM
jgi:hypothetical protein